MSDEDETMLTLLPIPVPDTDQDPEEHRKASWITSGRTDRNLLRVQRYSSYAFSLFSALHFTNTALIPLLSRHPSAADAVASADSYLLLTRPIYQTPSLETALIVVPLGLHVASGLSRRLIRRRRALDRLELDAQMGSVSEDSDGAASLIAVATGADVGIHTGVPAVDRAGSAVARTGSATSPLHAIAAAWRQLGEGWPSMSGTEMTGYMLLPAVLGHAFINRVLPLLPPGQSLLEFLLQLPARAWRSVVGGEGAADTLSAGNSLAGLEFVAHGFAKHPLIANAAYGFLVLTASWHFCWGAAKWLNKRPPRGTTKKELFRLFPAASYLFGPAGPTNYVLDKRNRRKLWWINGLAIGISGAWLASVVMLNRVGPAEGWVGNEFDRVYGAVI